LRAVENLVDAGVIVFAASGNRGLSGSMAAPACNSNVIAVGATYDGDVGRQPPLNVGSTYAARWGQSFGNCSDDDAELDQITCFTNSNDKLELVAPGAPMLSDSLNNRTELYWGTSQASPVAAAVAALMFECDPELTPAEIKAAMIDTGVMRMDAKNGMSFPSLRALDAVRAVCGMDDAGVGGAGVGGQGGTGGVPTAGAAGAMPQGGAAGGVGGAVSVPTPTAGMMAPVMTAGVGGGVAGSAGLAAPSGGAAPLPTFYPPAPAKDESGCACTIVGAPRRAATPWLLPISLVLAVRFIARRRRCVTTFSKPRAVRATGTPSGSSTDRSLHRTLC
jgi:hypothetical protein